MKKKITIEGMHCASCASNIERGLKKVKGIREVRVSIMMKKGYVECEDDVKDENIVNAVKKVGYKVREIENE